jgi:hypothetical protein
MSPLEINMLLKTKSFWRSRRQLIGGAPLYVLPLLTLTLFLTACPNNSDNGGSPTRPFIPPICPAGTICNTGVGGTALLNGPTLSYLDQNGTALILNFGAAGGAVAGRQYNGPIHITGEIRLPQGCGLYSGYGNGYGYGHGGGVGYGSGFGYNTPGTGYGGGWGGVPPGTYQVRGQGQWVGGYGGSVAVVTATLTMGNGGQIYIQQGIIGASSVGLTNVSGVNSGYYLEGNVAATACQRNFVACRDQACLL